MLYRTSKILGALCLMVLVTITGCDQPTEVSSELPDQDNSELPGKPGDTIEGEYIVVLDIEVPQVAEKGKLVNQVEELRSDVIADFQITPNYVLNTYEIALQGFAAVLSDKQLEKLRNDSRVKYIEENEIIMLAPPCGTPTNPCDDDGGGVDSGEMTRW